MNKYRLILCCGLAISIFGCASAKKAELSSNDNPKAAVYEVIELAKAAEAEQVDLLSFKEYTSASGYLAKAQKGLAGNSEKTYILDNAAIAKAYFLEANANAKTRRGNATRMLHARKSALEAGLKNSESLVEVLADVDDNLRDETDEFVQVLEPRDLSDFQKKYFALEVRAVQYRELNAVEESIQRAADEDADELAPNSLRTALLDVNEAQNIIAQSPRDPGIYGASVTKAVESAVLLEEVMAVILNAKGTPEEVALKIVYQNRELAKLSENVGTLEKDLKTTQSSLQQTEGKLEIQNEALKTQSIELKTKDQELASTRSNLQETESALIMQNEELEKSSIQIRFQNAMDEAVKQFSEDEASVYQQESKLIFRLKRINFASGNATIPAASKPLLGKINNIIKTIGAEIVAVQGHTDSVGSAELNSTLSTKRAISVADYLASLAGGYKIGYIGYGESRPIASNETKEGRAINRRVDLVVTARKYR